MLDWLPSEDLVPWRLMAADFLVGVAIVAIAYLVGARLAARPPASVLVGGRWARLVVACSLAGLVILIGRGAYGPPLRLALTAVGDRPAQRFADRVARSPELRAWYARRTAELRASGESEDMIPRTLSYERSELRRNGFSRLSDAQLKLRTDLLARAFSGGRGIWRCTSILGGDEDGVACAMGRDRAASEAWFQLIFQAMVADAQGFPPRRRVSDEGRKLVRADLSPRTGPAGLGPAFRHTPTESGSNLLLDRCDRERSLYATVSGWDGPRRAAADLLLATVDSYLTGELVEADGEPVE